MGQWEEIRVEDGQEEEIWPRMAAMADGGGRRRDGRRWRLGMTCIFFIFVISQD
jgi:hypothetical protein